MSEGRYSRWSHVPQPALSLDSNHIWPWPSSLATQPVFIPPFRDPPCPWPIISIHRPIGNSNDLGGCYVRMGRWHEPHYTYSKWLPSGADGKRECHWASLSLPNSLCKSTKAPYWPRPLEPCAEGAHKFASVVGCPGPRRQKHQPLLIHQHLLPCLATQPSHKAGLTQMISLTTSFQFRKAL